MVWWRRVGVLGLAGLCTLATAYEVSISEKDYLREICSGMWANDKTYINVTFSPESTGRIALLIYEFEDMEYLGKLVKQEGEYPYRVFVCTNDALGAGLCDESALGEFIINLPQGKGLNETSIWTSSISFGSNSTAPSNRSSSSFWNNPAGNPVLPDSPDNGPTNWRVRRSISGLPLRQVDSSASTQADSHTIHYPVSKKGYYCVGTVPVTSIESGEAPVHATFQGTVYWRNTFRGELPATDYPKITFYFVMTLAYLVMSAGWGFLCFQHKDDILPIQIYVSALMGLLVTEMLANWAYYRFLNAHGSGVSSTAFLIVVSILSAGSDALSFFLLLVVSLGLSVVREELPNMLRCKVLAVAHFVFGVIYAVAVVEIDIETVTLTTLFFVTIPLAFTLSTFLLWIMYGLQGTMGELAARKQGYKLSMFKKLNLILILAILVIVGFFIATSFSFSSRYQDGFAAGSWPYRWWLMDGYLSILYLIVFASIAFLWRPTGNNRR